MYERWFNSSDTDYVICKEFINRSASLLSNKCFDCTSLAQCGMYHISVDPDGFVYPCSTFSSNKKWRYGNINNKSLSAIMHSKVAKETLNRKIDQFCIKCKWQSNCNGGCYSRAHNLFKTIHHRDYYCASFKKIYSYIEKKLANEQ